MTRRRALVTAVAAVVLLGGLALLLSWRSVDDTIPTYKVEARDFARRVTAEGMLEAVKSTPITSPNRARRPMKIATLLPNGTAVKKDDVLVTFDPTDFETELKDGDSLFAMSRNSLSRQDVLAAAVQKNLKLDAEQAQREYDAATQFASKDPTIFSRFIVIESAIDQDLALQKRDNADRVRTTRGDQARADRELVEIEQRKATIKIDGAKEGLEALTIRAPHDGIFVLKPNPWNGEIPQVGQTVWRGFPIGELPELTAMQAEIFVLEADAGGLKVGIPAEVIVESQPGRSYAGKIKSVEPLAKPRMRGVPVQYFSARVDLDKTDPAVMKPGARILATLTLEKKAKAIAVPRQALFERKGKTVVFRRSGAGFSPVEVTLGSSSPGKVIIEKGLAAGDVIALRDPEDQRETRK